MNTYNDNLRDSVVESLNAIETEIINTMAKKDASMFSLYFAEGAKITALDKFTIEKDKYSSQSDICIESVTNENIAINLLNSATQEKDLVAQSVTNTAVAAANVQVAANAVLKLASDVGSILSIVLAADYNTEISKLTRYTNSVMNDTAYSAELASQIAMESAYMTAMVSATTVEEQATVTLASITSLTEKLAASLDAINAKMIADGAALDAASLIEKKAEGNLEDMTVEYSAIVNAYNENRKDLNLDLRVEVSSPNSLIPLEPVIKTGKVTQSGAELKGGTQQVIKGKVIDKEGNPLPAAEITVVGDQVGTVTDFDGEFELTVQKSPLNLKISYVGFDTLEFEVDNVNLAIELAKEDISKGKVNQSGAKLKDGTPQVIKGSVSDKEGNPLIGVEILVVGSYVGTITNIDGGFVLEVEKSPLNLKVSYVGFETLEFEVHKVKLAIELASPEEYPIIPISNGPLSDHQFEVCFEPYTSPFPYYKVSQTDKKTKGDTSTQTKIPGTGYPVESYFIYVVENSMKSTFSLSYAESLIEQDPQTKLVQQIDAKDCKFKADSKKKVIYHVFDQSTKDIEGKDIEKGKEYVVFVMAVLETKYKKLVNDFEDFLSAPSSPFMLTNKLMPANPKNFKVETNVKFTFSVKKANPKEEFRCIFLPKSEAATNGLLTLQELIEIQNEIMLGGKIANLYDPSIVKLESRLGSLKSYKEAYEKEKEVIAKFSKEIKDIESKIADKTEKLKKETSERKKATLITKIEEHKESIIRIGKKIEKINQNYPSDMFSFEDYEKELNFLKSSKGNEVKLNSMKCTPTIDFIFNKLIAEQIAKGNYYVADKSKPQPNSNGGLIQMEYDIKPEITDNFGNRIIRNHSYIPVVLTYSTASAENVKQFENALSDYLCTKPQILIGKAVVTEEADA